MDIRLVEICPNLRFLFPTGTLNQHGYQSILQQLVGLSFFVLFFNRTMTQHTSRLCNGYFTNQRTCIRGPGLHNLPDLNQIEMVWDKSNCIVKEKQPTSAQHLWELLQDCWKSIPGEAGWENAKMCKAVIKAKGGYLKNSHIFGYYMIPYMLSHSQNSTKKEKPLNE